MINSCCNGELLGLNASNNGCSCEQHECYGKVVKQNDVIRFKLAVVEYISGKPLESDDQGCLHQGWHRTLYCCVSGEGSYCIAFAKAMLYRQVHAGPRAV